MPATIKAVAQLRALLPALMQRFPSLSITFGFIRTAWLQLPHRHRVCGLRSRFWRCHCQGRPLRRHGRQLWPCSSSNRDSVPTLKCWHVLVVLPRLSNLSGRAAKRRPQPLASNQRIVSAGLSRTGRGRSCCGCSVGTDSKSGRSVATDPSVIFL